MEVSPLIYALAKLGIKPDEVRALIENAQSENATQGLSKHSAMLLQDLLTNTHFQIDHVKFPCLTTRGTRPGDPVADVLFNLTMSLILKDVRDNLLQPGQVDWFGQAEHCQDLELAPEMPTCGFAEVVFVDDVALLMHGPDNSVIEQIATKAVSAIVAAAARRGLTVSFEKGKTELMWEVRGQGSRKYKKCLSESSWQVEVGTVDGPKTLRVVHAYKHLGTWVQSGALVAKDISHRVAGARSAWGALHRPFYCKSTVADRTKLQVFQATSMSKHIYNAHTWSKISPADLNNWIQKLRPMLYSFARKFLHGQAPFKFSIEVLAGIIQFLSPLDQLHISRLRYLKRLTRYCPAVLWRVLCEVQSEPHSWIAHCRQSLQWFQKFHKKAPNLPVEAPFYQWMLAASEDISWTGKLKKAAWSCIQLRYSEAQYAIWLDHFEVQFVTAGGVIADRLQVPTEEWRCEICSEQCGSKRALAMHAHKKHQYRKIAKYFAMDGLCNACMKQFHCRSRLCNHLNGRGRCLDILQAVFPPLPEEVVEQLDQEDRETAHQLKQEGWRSTKAFEPAITQLGPQVPRPGDEGLADFRRRCDLRTGAPGTAFHNLQGYCASINHANEADCHDTPKFVMQSAGGQCDGAGLLGTGGLAKMAACLHIHTLVFVHFFSGYRRQSDIHHVIDQRALQGGQQLFVISVDLCMGQFQNNLLDHRTQQWWLEQIWKGIVMGAGGGSPCESYSAARFLPDGPKPLRTAEFPCGIPTISKRGWEQVRAGTMLAAFLLEVLLNLARVGGCGFAEHPSYPLWARQHNPDSLWSKRPVRLLKTLSCFSVVSFDQCILECEARKPTTLLLLRLPKLRETLLRKGDFGRCHHGHRAHQGLAGKKADGTFRTAVAKVYPPAMNQCIGEAIYDFACSTFDLHTAHGGFPEVFESFQGFDFVDMDCVQPDFHV